MSDNNCPHRDKIIEHEFRINGLEKETVATRSAIGELHKDLSGLTANLNQIKWLIAGGLMATLGTSGAIPKIIAFLL